jgi:hypothetical protein
MKTLKNFLNEGLFDRFRRSKNIKTDEPVKMRDNTISIMFGLALDKENEKYVNKIIEIITSITKATPGESGVGLLDGEVFASYTFDCNNVENIEGCIDEIIQEIRKIKYSTAEITEKTSRYKRVDVEISQPKYFQLFVLAHY